MEFNLAWKDTVLIRTGQSIDTPLDITHPRAGMAHCHTPDHHKSGMMF